MFNKGSGKHSGVSEAAYGQDILFSSGCSAADVDPSYRQLSKWKRGVGAARMITESGAGAKASYSEAIRSMVSRLKPAPIGSIPQRYEPRAPVARPGLHHKP
jgi:hypothetical protein